MSPSYSMLHGINLHSFNSPSGLGAIMDFLLRTNRDVSPSSIVDFDDTSKPWENCGLMGFQLLYVSLRSGKENRIPQLKQLPLRQQTVLTSHLIIFHLPIWPWTDSTGYPVFGKSSLWTAWTIKAVVSGCCYFNPAAIMCERETRFFHNPRTPGPPLLFAGNVDTNHSSYQFNLS